MTSRTEKIKILIVDDISENLLALENILSELNVDVIRAQSGNEALDATLHHDFSLILLDILMPGMNGIEIAEVLKQNDQTTNVPIIFITAMDKDESCELKAYSKGAVDLIYKPFNKVVLLSKVKVLLNLYSPEKDTGQVIFRQEIVKPKILLVDDNPENILVLKKLLSKLNVTIVTASSGNAALSETLYNDFAVIFLDVQMPGMDGYEVADLLKSEEKTAGIPIIFITAIDRDDTKEIQGYDKGAVDFIFKPFNKFILLSKTKVFLDIYTLKSGLEELVAEKTYTLKKINKKLEKEIARKEIVEKELIQTKSYLSSVFNSISSILIGADTTGIINDMNMAAIKISGVSFDNAQGKYLDDVFPFFSEITTELLALAHQNERIKKTNVAMTVGGVEGIYSFAVYPLIGGDLHQVVIRVDDVTETKQMEQELQQRRHIDSLGQLAGGIAHDFNNMLGVIMGATELLRIKAGEDSTFTKQIESILTAVERSADLTGKLLSFARKRGSEKIPVNMHHLIKDTVIILQRSIDKRINIVVKTDATNSVVEGDDSELSNALLNLGINARDAMPNGGTLTISTVNRTINDLQMPSVRDLPDGLYLELCVSDTGIGMTDAVRTKVFEPFFTTKEPGKGTGLGLASVYGTIKAHSGAILLESSFGKGSSFTLLLPIGKKGVPNTSTNSKVIAEEEISGTVLLVDDEENIRSIGTDLLSELGLKVITAENGLQAIDIITERKEEISLILLDMIMPKMNGRDCYQEIKKIMPKARVVICSGYAPEETISELRVEGVFDVIRKPFRFAELRAVIQACLSNSAK